MANNGYHRFEQRRIDLHSKLVAILGSNNVYYQPDSNIEMEYPAIVYERYDMDTIYSDNRVHATAPIYKIIVIDTDPDSIVVDKISQFLNASYVNHYRSANLHHDVFKITY